MPVKDMNVMLELLKKMSEAPIGAILIRQSLGMDTSAQNEYHQAELLTDLGFAKWKSESMIRITSRGYDFLDSQGNS